MNDIELKNVKIIEGYPNLIKYRFDKFLGYLKSGGLPIFQRKENVYLFSEFSVDEYRLGELGLKVEPYYKNLEKRYKLFLHSVFLGASNVKDLHERGVLTDEIYKQVMAEEKERVKSYAQERIKDLKKQIEYLEKMDKQYESNS